MPSWQDTLIIGMGMLKSIRADNVIERINFKPCLCTRYFTRIIFFVSANIMLSGAEASITINL